MQNSSNRWERERKEARSREQMLTCKLRYWNTIMAGQSIKSRSGKEILVKKRNFTELVSMDDKIYPASEIIGSEAATLLQ